MESPWGLAAALLRITDMILAVANKPDDYALETASLRKKFWGLLEVASHECMQRTRQLVRLKRQVFNRGERACGCAYLCVN